MKAVALRTGFIDGRRVRPGAVVDVPEGFKASWLTSVAKAPRATEPVKDSPVALSKLGNAKSKSFNEVHAPTADLV